MTTRTLTPSVLLLGLLVGFFVSGCYTQLAKPGLDRDTRYEDDNYYEEEYTEADTSYEAEVDSTVYHRHDVYFHDRFGPYPNIYDSWWYSWDPYYYPWRFHFAWRSHYYWDPWWYSYSYWGDPWYWTPFSYYGGWAYYRGWGWPSYRYSYRYEYAYKRRPFRRDTFYWGRSPITEKVRMMTEASKRTSLPSARISKISRTEEGDKLAVSKRVKKKSSDAVRTPVRKSRQNTKTVRRVSKSEPRVVKQATRTRRETKIVRRVSKSKPRVVKQPAQKPSTGNKGTVRKSRSSSSRPSSSASSSRSSRISRSRSYSTPSISRSSSGRARSSGSSGRSSAGSRVSRSKKP